jgi:hypothetical protein
VRQEVTVKTWDVFISHASEDKLAVTVPLAEVLQRAGLRVWLDRQELRIGDSLHEKINEGLANSRFGIVVLSPSFLAKGWPRNELDGLLAIEDAVGTKIILPVWHQIDKALLAKHSPILADRLAADTAEGIQAVASSIIAVVTEPGRGAHIEVQPTPLRLLIDLLERGPKRTDVVGFLASYPRILHTALNSEVGSERWSTKLGSAIIDFCASRHQYTTGELTWYLVQFQPPDDALFLGSTLSPGLAARSRELREVRRWIGGNIGEASRVLPQVGSNFKGVVVAGRRHQLSETDQNSLRSHNQELPGITVRTYDWLIDAADESTRMGVNSI